jgi:adenosylmethionine-8-amino-7-oxononanoate aminotransferase
MAAAGAAMTQERLQSRDERVCWHPYTQHGLNEPPLPVVRAQGAWLELEDGRRLLDAVSSWWTCLHGHGHPRLRAALERQAARLDHVLFAGCTHEGAVALAEKLVALAPEGLSRVFYSDDGSTAVEVALKAAYQYWLRRGETSRQLFLALEGGYHGDTFGAMAAGDPEPFFREFEPLLCRVVRAPLSAQGLERVFAEHGRRAAALIVEPLVQGAGGMRVYPAALLANMRSLCDAYGVLLIVDEVMTGFGRTGTLFACEQAGLRPDLMCVAKGLTGGMLPLAATLTTEAVYAAFLSRERGQALFHGHSFTASALGCAVALESLALVVENQVPGRLREIGSVIAAGLQPLAGRRGVRSLRRCGGIVAVELDSVSGGDGYLSDLGPRLRDACKRGDVLLRPLGNVLYAMPPACTSDDEARLIGAAMVSACEAVLDADSEA